MDSICTTINGLWKGEKAPLVNIGVIRNANFTKEFTLDYSKIEYINVESRSFEKRYLDDGDIIVEKSGGSDNFPVGRSILYSGESRKYSFSNFTMSLRIIDKRAVLPRYLYYVLQQKYRRGDMKQMQTQTTGLHNLLSDVFLSMPIPIPPKEEQQRIIERVDALFTIVSELDVLKDDFAHSINAAKSRILDLAIHGKLVPQDPSEEPAIELLKRINPAFKPSHNLHYADRFPTGWAEFPLYAICEILDSQRKPVNSKEREKRVEKAKTLYPYYGATGQVGLIDNYILDGDYLLLGEDGAPFLDRYANKAYSVSGRIWVNNHAHILKPRINPTYMMYYLNAIQYRPYVTGTTRLKLTQEVMRNIPVLVPPLAEQARIISRVEQLFRVIDAIQLDK